MAIIRASEPSFMTAEQAAQRLGYAASSELALRNAMEDMLRARMPDARIVHELVMGARQVRADVVGIATNHIAAVEVKGDSDDCTRLLHQVGMYQLCVPEVWILVSERNSDDAKLIRHLMPSIGLIIGHGISRRWYDEGEKSNEIRLEIEAAAAPRDIVPEMTLEMLWASELYSVVTRNGFQKGKSKKVPTRWAMIETILEKLTTPQIMSETCIELRSRDALWRADKPLPKQEEPHEKVF